MANPVNPVLSKREIQGGGQVYYHWCPGCKNIHGIYTNQASGHANWTFNGNMEVPHFDPSIRCMGRNNQTTCHYFVHNGVQEFCSDSPHAFAGQNIALQSLPDWVIDEEKEPDNEET